MLTIPTILRKDAGPRVAVADVLEHLGVQIPPHQFGVPVASDNTMSWEDAAAFVEEFTEAQAERCAAWSRYLESCRAWEGDRIEVCRAATAAARVEALREGMGLGCARARGRRAGRDAAAHYERTVPRPAWNGEPGFGNVARLLYTDPSDTRGAER